MYIYFFRALVLSPKTTKFQLPQIAPKSRKSDLRAFLVPNWVTFGIHLGTNFLNI